MEVWQDPAAEMKDALERKLNGVGALLHHQDVSQERREIILEKIRKGHEEHQQKPEDIDNLGELVGEMADLIGYMANIIAASAADSDAPEWTVLHDEFVTRALGLWDLLDAISEMKPGDS